jgi:uncharacterized RDD family membrane protein YckC
MYALKRIVAYLLDYAIVLTPTLACLGLLEHKMGDGIPGQIRHHLGLVSGGVSLLAPPLVIGVLTGLTGRTPGKLITFLRVQDHGGDPPGIAEGIVREIIKAVSLAFFFGMIYALQAVVTNRRTFYDEWLDLDVEDLRPSGLTETQKNFRKYMREKQRRERR